jgi:hypothetical protein
MRNWSIGRDVPKARTKIQPTTQKLISRQEPSLSARCRVTAEDPKAIDRFDDEKD